MYCIEIDRRTLKNRIIEGCIDDGGWFTILKWRYAMWWRTLLGLNENIPVLQKPPGIFWALNTASCAWTNAVVHSTFWIWETPRLISGVIILDITFLNGPKILTLRGSIRHNVCGGIIIKMMLLSIQCAINLPVMWLSCPSQIKRLFAFSSVSDSK